MKKTTSEELDQLFQNSLHNLEVNPREENWNKINDQLKHFGADNIIKSKLEEIELKPNHLQKTAILKKINTKLVLDRYLKIAAGLFVLIGIFYFSNPPQQENIALVDNLDYVFDDEEVIGYAVCKDPILVSLDLNKAKVTTIKKKKRKKKSSIKSKQLLDYILEEDENVEGSLDPDILASILAPASALPFENMTVSNEDYNSIYYGDRVKEMYPLPEIEILISIPLQILEDHEIADLLAH